MSDSGLTYILASRSPTILHQLQWTGFRRLDLKVETAAHADALVAQLKHERPSVVILDSDMDGGDAFDLCKKIKKQYADTSLPVIIHHREGVSRDMHARLRESRCDELLVGSLSRGQVYEAVAGLLELPTRASERIQVAADAIVKANNDRIDGHVFDLTVSGVRLILSKAIPGNSTVTVTLQPRAQRPIDVSGRVVWCTERSNGAEVALQFTDVDKDVQTRLHQITSWENVEVDDDRQTIRILRGLTDRTNLDELADQLGSTVDFDLGNVLSVTSFGVSKWVNFLREIPETTQYRLVRCSTAFCTQASYVSEMIGRGVVVSVYAPYYSAKFDHEAEREIVLENLGDAFPPSPPDFPCPLGGMMSFDDLPDRYFHFLKASSE